MAFKRLILSRIVRRTNYKCRSLTRKVLPLHSSFGTLHSARMYPLPGKNIDVKKS